ncbi:Flagellar hook protein FlgE [bioreactor metagenome]|uniref:Flagellar hook protein FlgE n=1 Tax=bioreactor metagenome TaxID=1076179 RepID=A0A645H5D5_9ZZZZ
MDRAKTDYTDMAETENMLTQAELPGVFTFINPAALTRDGNGRLSATGASGEAVADPNAKVISGALEGSNVDIARELTDLLSAQRGFELSAKVIQTADELENIANNLRS